MKTVCLGRAAMGRQIFWLLTLLFILRADFARATVFTWTNTASGNWSNPSNWSPNGTPGSSDDASITNAGSYTVTLDTSPSVASLTLGGGGQQTLAVGSYTLTLANASVVNANGVLTLSGGTLNDNGGLTVNGQIVWIGGTLGTANVALNIGTNGSLVMSGGSGATYVLGQPLGNAGTVQLEGGNLLLHDGYSGSLVNLPGGVVELTSDNVSISQYGFGPGFNNEGILVKTGGNGTSTITTAPFNNSGTVEANTGSISINSTAATFADGSLFIGGGQTVLSGGTATFNGSLNSSNLVLNGATIQVNGVLNGVLTWISGQLGSLNETLTIATNAELVLAGNSSDTYYLGQPLNNEGTFLIQGGNVLLHDGYSGSLTNAPGGVVDLAGDFSISQYGFGPGFINEGILVKSGGTGTSTISTEPFNNSGTVEANTGTISINSGTATFADGSLFIGGGQTVLSGGVATFNGSLNSSNLVLNGATMQVSGVLNGVLTWISGTLGTLNETLTIATNAELVLAGNSGDTYYLGQTLNNEGTFLIQSGNVLIHDGYSGILTNAPSGVVDLAGDFSISQYGAGPGFINEGILVKSGGTGTSTISTAPFNNSGTVAANTGTISINSGAANFNPGSLLLGVGQVVLSGGTATLTGSVTSSNLVLNGAFLQGNGVFNGMLTWINGQLGSQNETLTIATNAVLVLAGNSGSTYYLGQTLNIEGTFNLQSGNVLIHDGLNGILTNAPGGVVDLGGNVVISQYGGGPGFVNEGTLLGTAGTNTGTISSVFNNSGGSISVASGAISLSGNNFAQDAGVFAISLGGTNNGQTGALTGVGNAALDGLLTVTLTNGFVPALGSTFQILSSASLSGTLSPLNIPAGLSVSYSNSGVYLTVTGAVALAPAIALQPTNATVPYAGSAVFTVAATGMTPLGYHWLQNGTALSDGGGVAGSASPNLVLNAITDNNAGNYSVVITNSFGSVTSVVATLTVLNCTAPPSGLVSWWPGDGNALDIVGGNNGTLVDGVTFTNGEVGQAFGFNGVGGSSNTGQAVNISPVSPNLDMTNGITIEAWVKHSSLVTGGAQRYLTIWLTNREKATLRFDPSYGFHFYVSVNGAYYQLQSGVFPETNTFYHVAGTFDGNTESLFLNGNLIASRPLTGPLDSGAVSASISAAFEPMDGLIDEPSVYNRALSSSEIAAIYGAGAAGKCLTEAPAITGQPQSQSVVLGGTATFNVIATGLLPFTNQWQLNGNKLADNARITGSQSNVLTVTNVQFADAGAYVVSVTNVVGGTVSQSATLVVLRKTPALAWSNAAPITYGAALNNAQLNATSNVPGSFAYNPPAGAILGAGSYLLSVVFTPADTVDYNSVTKYVSLVVSNAPLTVTANPASRAYGQANPAFSGTIVGLQGLDNITANYSCAAVPASPPAGYPIVPSLIDPFGRLANYSVTLNNGTLTVGAAAPPTLATVLPVTGSTNGGQIVTLSGTNFEAGASVNLGSAPASAVNVSSPTALTLTTPASSPGVVSVTLHNPDGNQASLPNSFTFGIPPSIQVQPLSQSVVVNSNAQFQVQASGQGTLSYQWQFNGANLLNLGGISGVQTPTLNVSNLVTADGGSYQVVIANTFGTLVSTAAVLTVLSPPSVSAPQSVAVGVGATAGFSVTAGGTPPFGYQWYQGSGLLSGATNPVLNFSSVQSSNAGQYTVVVTNIVGSVTSSQAVLTVLGYCASAQAGQSLYPSGTTIPITAKTYNCGTQATVASSAAALWIYNAGTVRTIPFTTDSSGSATVNFTPLMGEVGVVQFAAALPGVNNPAAQGAFTLLGMSLSPAVASPVLTVGLAQTNTITLSNLTSVALSGLTATVSGVPANVSVQVSVPGNLPANGTVQATYILEASGSSPSQAQINLQFATAAGVTNNFPINATIVQLEPQLVTLPSTLHGTMVPGSQTLVSFGLANVGGTTSGGLQVILPASAPWLSVATVQPLASLIPGQTNQITLALTPTNGLTLGAYSGTLIIAGANFQTSVPFTFNCVSTKVGNLQVTAQDEFTLVSPGAPNLSNATVTVTDYLTGSNVASAVTGPSGMVLFTNLTSAYYTIEVEATNHGGFTTTLLVQPDETNNVTAFLPDNLVSYSWVVTPTTIPDDYEFTLITVFQTQVPWPVVTISPGAINLCQFSGTTQIDLVITNSGLISAQGLQLSFGTNANWSIVPLAGNLGDLAAESSIVVPVVITQLGASTAADSSIAAQLNWHVFTPTQTNYYTTPIYVYNANPNNCMISSTPVVNVTSSGGGGSGGGGGGGGGGGEAVLPATPYVAAPSYSFAPPVVGAIVDVTLQINQHAVIARDAFKATLQINNTAGSAISNLKVTINPVDAAGHPASSAFDVVPPTLAGLNAVDGTGTLANGASGTASWTIIPGTNAAPTGPTTFAIGGTLSYVLDGQQVVIPLFAVPINVLPSPILDVDYFLQHDVYSQDPFTSQVEPSVPFGLGLIVHNQGLGAASDFTITSAQPTIIANSNGLLIAFEIIGSQAGTNSLPSPSLTMDLGAIPAGGDVTGLWLMTSTLEGAFISYSATFQHVNALGATNTSLVNKVAIHEMNHIVRITVPEDDGIPDFLVNDTTNVDALPDNVYSSAGPVSAVTSLTNVTVIGTPSPAQSNVTVTVSAPPGWVYLQFPDPASGTMTIASVQRSDGVNLLVGPNVWQTPERDHMLPPQPQNLVHLFDYNSTGSYTITYGPMVTAPTVTTLAAVATNSVSATLNALVNPNNGSTTVYYQWGTTTNYTGATPPLSLTQSLNTLQDAAFTLEGLQPSTTYHFEAVAVNSAGTSFGGDVTFTTPNANLPIISQVGPLSIAVGQTLVITNQANTAVVYSLDRRDPPGAGITTNGVFYWRPACEQGSSTNEITIWATDIAYPTVSNSMSFPITVGDCVEMSIGSTPLLSGQEACVAVNLLDSSIPLNTVQFALQFPPNEITNLTISSTNLAVGAAILVSTSPTLAQFRVSALSGRSLQGPATIAEICFEALGTHSTFLPVTLAGIQGTQANGSLVGNSTGASGQVALVAAEPLLQAGVVSNSMFVLTLYGIPGSNYVIQSSSTLGGNQWQSAMSMILSNVVNPIFIGGGSSNPPAQFYRAYKQ